MGSCCCQQYTQKLQSIPMIDSQFNDINVRVPSESYQNCSKQLELPSFETIQIFDQLPYQISLKIIEIQNEVSEKYQQFLNQRHIALKFDTNLPNIQEFYKVNLEHMGISPFDYESFYQGQWENQQMSGYGKLYFFKKFILEQQYEGFFKNNFPNGLGRLVSEDHSYYIGYFKNGEYDAEGYYVNSDGDVFFGNYFRGKKNGYFNEIIKTKNQYFEGVYKNDKKNGRGKFIFFKKMEQQYDEEEQQYDILQDQQTHDEYYEGNFQNNGDRYEGEWNRGKMFGKGKFFYRDGNVYEGLFKNDQRSGFGILKYIDDRIYKGQWENDLQNGAGIMLKQGEPEQRGIWKDGKKIQQQY